jgi:NAD-dependent DNA ligase
MNKIEELRRLLLVHSCIYYIYDYNVISDAEWQYHANRLVELQNKYKEPINFYDKEFEDWNGNTGCHLPLRDEWVVKEALRLME